MLFSFSRPEGGYPLRVIIKHARMLTVQTTWHNEASVRRKKEAEEDTKEKVYLRL